MVDILAISNAKVVIFNVEFNIWNVKFIII